MLAAAQQREAAIGFLFVNQGESAGHGARLPVARRPAAARGAARRRCRLGPAVGSRGLPTTLFYDAGGRLVDAHFGMLNAAALASRICDPARRRRDVAAPLAVPRELA